MTLSVTSHKTLPREIFTKTGNSIYNDEIRLFLAERIQQWFSDPQCFSSMVSPQSYVDEFRQWILSSKINKISGLETFPNAVISLGVTQALDQFHSEILRNGLKLRICRGEYPYNRDVHPFCDETDYIDDRPLEAGDAVVLSCPFSASGEVHPQMNAILERCADLKIPVFVDLAWFGTCGGLEVDLSHPAIHSVAFSLTKGLTCGNYRSGIRLTRNTPLRPAPEDRLQLQFEWNHGIHLNTFIGKELMRHFGPDSHFLKYREAQLAVCKMHSLTPSLCVHIATSKNPEWNEFSRDGFCNRINLREAIKKYLQTHF